MKLPLVTAIALVLMLAAATAWGQVAYVPPPVVGVAAPVAVQASPARVVYHYWPTAPVAVQPVVVQPMVSGRRTAIVTYPGTVVGVPTSVLAPVSVVVPATVYPAPAVIRTKVYYPGQPVRNALRAVLP